MVILSVRRSLRSLYPLLATVTGCFDGHAGPADALTLDCSQVGCAYVAELNVPYGDDEADLIGGIGRVCHNDSCGEVTIQGVPPSDGVGVGDDFSGGLTGSFYVFRNNGDWSLMGRVWQYARTFTTGDIYTLTFTAMDGRPLVDGRWIAREYVTSYPNGATCGPECFTARLEELPLETGSVR